MTTSSVSFLLPPQPDGQVVRTVDTKPCTLDIRSPGVDGEDREVIGRYCTGPDGKKIFVAEDGHIFRETEPGKWEYCYEIHESRGLEGK
ncbi:hypothetical protein HY949_01240 [Candidatus Gottesmanbacteria bacterium]|nr:hypothetical protein [Candidatus Gottesmanbacteria bacterium]